jgi:hypothetical protein
MVWRSQDAVTAFTIDGPLTVLGNPKSVWVHVGPAVGDQTNPILIDEVVCDL